jgi:hypothetical protein
METLSIILISLSALAVIFALIFEGKLKKDRGSKSPIKVWPEIKNVTLLGWTLISISILMSVGNGIVAKMNMDDNTEKYIQDTTIKSKLLAKSTITIDELRFQRHSDSLQIANLKELTINRSDSIKNSIVDVAVKELAEQRKILNRERENIFKHFQNEVKDNLRKILINFSEERIIPFGDDTANFISTRLNNTYIKKFELISTQDAIVDHLMETSETIDKVNFYADEASHAETPSVKKLNIRMFLSNVKVTQNLLYSIYSRVFMLKSYEQYESINFNDSISLPNRDSLNGYIYWDTYKTQMIE